MPLGIENETLEKCEALKLAGIWPSGSKMNARSWLNNFDENDRPIAALLLSKFTYYNQEQSDALLVAAYNSIGDGLPKGPKAPNSTELIKALDDAVLTMVSGENPNPTDSGFLYCRKARQVLHISESLQKDPVEALLHAINGGTVVFIDDFIGSGDQFLKHWEREYRTEPPRSFKEVQEVNGFTAIYITLVSTDYGLGEIHKKSPQVAVCSTHIIGEKSTLFGLDEYGYGKIDIDNFLNKYSSRLEPDDGYMTHPLYLKFGYKMRGLLLAFEHSVPDATLPIFWSKGTGNWRCLVERA